MHTFLACQKHDRYGFRPNAAEILGILRAPSFHSFTLPRGISDLANVVSAIRHLFYYLHPVGRKCISGHVTLQECRKPGRPFPLGQYCNAYTNRILKSCHSTGFALISDSNPLPLSMNRESIHNQKGGTVGGSTSIAARLERYHRQPQRHVSKDTTVSCCSTLERAFHSPHLSTRILKLGPVHNATR
jgi:hypothetical protein